MRNVLTPVTAELDEETLEIVYSGSYSIHVSDPAELGRVADVLSRESDGAAQIMFNSDNDGNRVFTICGTVDDIFYIETVERKCNELGVKALFSY